MVKTFGSALTALGLVGALAACANPGDKALRSTSALGGKVDPSSIGAATRAQAALEKGDFASAVQFAERAVAANPNDTAMRALLGNSYFVAGRFASAEAAYRDSLTLQSGQPQLVLKLALVMIAQGKSGEALAELDAARGALDPSDYGLALALAGQPAMAVAVLEQAARTPGADSRVRQNLALAYALQGEWIAARTIASQDVPADQLDGRIQQWMTFAKPARASDQVAALTGIAPAPVDPGQPAQLALNAQPGQRLAMAEPVAAPAPSPEPAYAPVMAEPALPAPMPEPVAFAAAEPAPQAAFVPAAEPAPKTAETRKRPAKRAAAPVRQASFPKAVRGNSKAVVQIGAYAQRGFVGTAWGNLARKYPALRGYTPSSARFASAKGTVYRLSVQGFASDGDARTFCVALKRAGGNCFVRNVAGDAPVRLASL